MLRWFIILWLLTSTLFSVNAQTFGEPSAIRSIYFGGGSARVDIRQANQLKSFLDSIPNIHDYFITVHSHTDNIGGKEYNERLSKMRSQSVIDLMLKLEKIKKEMIEVRDFGLYNPVYDNSTWEGRMKNRRVDVILWLVI
ncbi:MULTISPECIES: OmpA family protein [Roseivirga]|mgnify:CR=1 FL=1|jgi:outer membrane protein OmpA-like peptidoglycan-associated protein|uniref:OmpA family protein n=1 Tax=Roseivirga TaxID=290180 RepID=UPI00257BCBD6|nr:MULTISPECIES: OmpA family protein [Roseivirga]MEC7755548.1 OmpA family protein [Bacteroidota bacterium]|tara:strand:+ start:11513 stop:11932 length:420 start_codon:yes stop_codon:yes gene_type:complete